MNKSPHIVGGGIGTFRKQARAAHFAANKAKGPGIMRAIAESAKTCDCLAQFDTGIPHADSCNSRKTA